MDDNLELQNQIEFFYNAAAKPLFNLALYATGDPILAQKVTINAFVDSFHSIPDKTDLELFMNKSIKLLYRYVCKAQKNDIDQAIFLKTARDMNDDRQKTYMDMLGRLSPNERYMLLLFCWQRFSVKRISKILSFPMFITKKRLYATMNKAAKIIREITVTAL